MFLFSQSLVFILVIIATPIEMYTSSAAQGCYTLWGYEENCNRWKPRLEWGCRERANTMGTAASFSVITLLLSLINIVLAAMTIYGRVRITPTANFVFSSVILATLTAGWACVVYVHENWMCGPLVGSRIGDDYHYGAGFGLLTVAWITQIFTVFLSVFRMFL
ncbi:amastin-like surface protein-like protein [Trypanosoma grayi]|uniref:amastin-like surface protein-like protein n=1 Tax=Trypanosoma grayi TaxID=71804 RepID=UPI0004F490A4|nr:amastin-like surface protein-like protein [Trypanosoma grayi]KEG08651.1 amastin-like surface protein-like protein [Trypanosoma grayi]